MYHHIDTTGEAAFRARITEGTGDREQATDPNRDSGTVPCTLWPVPSIGPLDTAICGALERLAEESAGAMRLARSDGDKAGGTFWQRNATSYTNALIAYRAGVRPELLSSGAWLLPSRRAGEAPHIVRMDGDWVCSCKAGHSAHWAVMLIIGIEVAHDDLDRFDDGDIDVEELPALGARIAEARRCYDYAA